MPMNLLPMPLLIFDLRVHHTINLKSLSQQNILKWRPLPSPPRDGREKLTHGGMFSACEQIFKYFAACGHFNLLIIYADSSEAAYWQMGVGGKLVCKNTHIDNTTTKWRLSGNHFSSLQS